MYKTFASEREEGLKRGERASVESTKPALSPQFLEMHAARCFLRALAGYEGSGWLAAEGYACTVLPIEVRRFSRRCFFVVCERSVHGWRA